MGYGVLIRLWGREDPWFLSHWIVFATAAGILMVKHGGHIYPEATADFGARLDHKSSPQGSTLSCEGSHNYAASVSQITLTPHHTENSYIISAFVRL